MAGGKKNQSRRPPTKRPPGGPRPAAAAPKAPPPPPGGTPKRTQAQRLEAARQAKARKSRNTRLGVAGAVLLVVGLLIANAVSNRSQSNALRTRLETGSCDFDTRNDDIDPPPNNHVAPGGYRVDPPAGGNHDPSAADAGTYSEANKPSDARIVHALEHGYIAVWHRPDLDEKDMATITRAVTPYERDVIVVPRQSLQAKVAVTAWGERLLCGEVESKPLVEFVKAYRNKGPERVPHP